MAASFQEAAVDILVTKTLRACQRTGLKRLVVGGGVAANRRLRQLLLEAGQSRGLQ
ncbi:MAG: tRNA (adenosine(37)-N6)-threonylcarbamoyltransferase complex transferase subunit TsaD, partial [Bacteroidota bacterium]